MEQRMKDLAGSIETRNYGIKPRTDVRSLFDLFYVILSVAAMASVLCFYLWVRVQITTAGYEVQRLQSEEEALSRSAKNLIAEEQMLKDPGRIDTIARMELGMTPLRAYQVLPAGLPLEGNGSPVKVALARGNSGRTEKPSANN
jgi:cell division protein FtsL